MKGSLVRPSIFTKVSLLSPPQSQQQQQQLQKEDSFKFQKVLESDSRNTHLLQSARIDSKGVVGAPEDKDFILSQDFFWYGGVFLVKVLSFCVFQFCWDLVKFD